MKKIIKSSLLIIFTMMLLTSCFGARTLNEFKSTYVKNQYNDIQIKVPTEDALILSKEVDFDNDGNNEKLEIYLVGGESYDEVGKHPLRFVMSRKDESKNFVVLDEIYPVDSDPQTSANLYSGYIGQDRLDIFYDDEKNIYFEESGLSGRFADGKTFRLIKYKFENNKFVRVGTPVGFTGSYPDLYQMIDGYEHYDEQKPQFEKGDLYYVKNIVEGIYKLGVKPTTIGYDYPIIETGNFTKLIRILRDETGTTEAGKSDEWYNDLDTTKTFGNITIKMEK